VVPVGADPISASGVYSYPVRAVALNIGKFDVRYVSRALQDGDVSGRVNSHNGADNSEVEFYTTIGLD
jgi:hypothetical protein